MSTECPAEIRILQEKVRFLEAEVRRLRSELAVSSQLEDDTWEVVEEARFSDQVPVTPSRDIVLEDGPIALPIVCQNLAEKNLKSGKYSPLQRAEAAFQTGFWVRIALDTCTDFKDTHSLKGLSPAYWVVFRGAIGGLPLRTARKSDAVRACGSARDIILVPVASLTELHIVCAGGGFSLPQLVQWRSQ
eukprot:Skav228633  [mRNA]  locus=scaffold204:29595:30161:+ [translate_table: standard]